MSSPQPGIVCTDLAFAWPDGAPVFAGLSVALGGGRAGLVAPNGAGKSTLLRLIAGELRPTGGAIAVTGRLAYLPQTLLLDADRSVADVLGIAPALAALRAIEAGDARDEVFAAIGDDWDVEERALTLLGRLGLDGVGLERTVGALSGGQATLLGLASRLLREPDVLLLDEPSNNLDLDARERLYAVVADWRGCLLIASHDRDLLGRVDRIAELSYDGIRLYGGDFDAYETAVASEQAAAEQAVRTAELHLKREAREAQDARERADRRSSAGKRRARAGGIPKIVAGGLQRKAEASAGRAGELHERRVEAARERLDQERRALRDDERIRITLPQTRVPAGRVLFEATGAAIDYDDRSIFGPAGIDLTIRGPERIALVGANGAGKTTLLRLIAGDLAPEAGRVRRYDAATIRTLPQRLDALDDDRSVLANLRDAAPGVPDVELRSRLAGFLFVGDHVHLPVRELSGGERLRATLACLLAAEPAPQLLLLDEPTNNLDLASVRQLEAALAAYEGALVVASHDLPFLAGIGITRRLRLQAGVGPVADEAADAAPVHRPDLLDLARG